ncbi:MAG: cytochrome-c peroxidase [Bacteroidetes bacterium]|nr:MAG: cytochrome-c peroxidase [Bacteroidota bacterium]
MKKWFFFSLPLLLLALITVLAFRPAAPSAETALLDSLREAYSSGDPGRWPAAELLPAVDRESFTDIGPLPEVSYPADNPFSPAKKKLGKLLFFDPRLSGSDQIACASCHNPELGWTDNLTRSFGHDRQTGKRNAMTIQNVAFAERLFWDGRASSLEDQARFPIADPLEMNHPVTLAVEDIAAVEGYKPYFAAAFGDEAITLERIKMAIATFERSIVSPPSRFDRFVQGKKKALNDQELLGLHLFRTKAGCINCHHSPYFSDNQFHNDGQALWGSKNEDLGRYNLTGDLADLGAFRTPTLREVTHTGPWMHHGHFPSLLDVVQFYNLGNPAPIQKKYLGTPRDSLIPEPSPLLRELDLTETEIEALLAFLGTLSTPKRRMVMPELPE